jgi:hypothetical protein
MLQTVILRSRDIQGSVEVDVCRFEKEQRAYSHVKYIT